MDVHNSLFFYASHELSHSAFWAWVLHSLNTDSDEFRDVRKLASKLLDAVGAPTPKRISVKREYKLPGDGGRIDIHAVLDGSAALLVENKVSARPGIGQLQSYESASELEEAYYLLLSTSYPTQEVDGIREEESWTYMNAARILAILNEVGGTHPFVQHYHSWVADLVATRQRLEEGARAADVEKRIEALRSVPGQWVFMKEAVAALTVSSPKLKSDTNASGGGVFTEFWFVRAKDDWDNVFYRLEMMSGEPVFRLEQYQQPPEPNWNAKKARLDELRELWNESIDEAGQLPWDQKNTGGKFRCEIGRLPLVDYGLQELRSELERVHPVYVQKLKKNGWPVG